MNGIPKSELAKPNLIQRLFGLPVASNAYTEIRNAIAERAIGDLQLDFAEITLAKYRIRPSRSRAQLRAIFVDVLRHFASDEKLTEAELRDLRRLRDAFGLSEEEVARLRSEAVESIYQRHLNEALADAELTTKEKQRLEKLVADLKLDESVVARIRREAIEPLVRRTLNQMIEDRRLSPQEDAELEALMRSLGATPLQDAATSATLDRFRLFWRIDQGELPFHDVPIRLQRGEVCHVSVAARRYELRTVTKRIRYGGPTARIRLAKGIYWRMGDLAVASVSREEMRHLDTGTLYITNKRFLFDGDGKSSNVPYRRVVRVEPRQNGIQVSKDSGKDQFYAFDTQHVELITLTVQAALRLWDA